MNSRWYRSIVEVAAVYGLLGFVYVALFAATRPQDLSAQIAAIVPLRKDTFGACCFAVSAVASFLLQQGRGPIRISPLRRRGALVAGLRTVFGYGLLAWAYLCLNSLTHPQTISQRLTHFASWPAEGSTADACFAVSALALLWLRIRSDAEHV